MGFFSSLIPNKIAIEAISTVHSTDFKALEVEMGIISSSTDEDEKSRGHWRIMKSDEVERWLLAYGEKD